MHQPSVAVPAVAVVLLVGLAVVAVPARQKMMGHVLRVVRRHSRTLAVPLVTVPTVTVTMIAIVRMHQPKRRAGIHPTPRRGRTARVRQKGQ